VWERGEKGGVGGRGVEEKREWRRALEEEGTGEDEEWRRARRRMKETGRREVRGAGGEAQVRAMKEGGKEGGRTSLGARQSHCGRDACV